MRMTALVPMLQTNDMARTCDWYEDVLGFRRVSSESDEWCRLERDDIAIMFMRNEHLATRCRRDTDLNGRSEPRTGGGTRPWILPRCLYRTEVNGKPASKRTMCGSRDDEPGA